MSRKRLMQEMDANEVKQWMSYEMLSDTKTRDKLTKEIHLEEQRIQTAEDEACRMKAFFAQLGGNN